MRSRSQRSILQRLPQIAAPFLLLAALACSSRDIPPEIPALIRSTVESPGLPLAARRDPEQAEVWREVGAFYRHRGYQPAWIDARGPLPQAERLVTAIGPADREGLDPRHYGSDRLQAMLAEVREERSLADPEAQRRAADLDLTLTYTSMALIRHLAVGRERPSEVDGEWHREPRRVDLAELLAGLLEHPESLDQALLGMAPAQPEYARLREALARYREIERMGGWPRVPAAALQKKKGATFGPVIAAALRSRLSTTGDLSRETVPGAGDLAQGIARFQLRHGLDPTGTVDADTLEALNVPVGQRIRQIEANMERWRWMPRDLGERYVRVNVPDFRLEVIERGRVALAQRVVVGKEQSRTPSFSGRMTYLVLNPTWNIPPKIAREEILPAVARDPGYLDAKGIDVVRGTGDDAEVLDASEAAEVGLEGSDVNLRARAGEENPLGKVKFMFPNRFDVYLHDTPADHLFAREERDFSHGCIRLEKPLELANYLLRGDPKWTPEKVAEEIAAGTTETVSLPRPIPVHILYWTAWVSDDGEVQFRRDVYGHDEALDEALRAEPPIAPDLPAVRGEVRAAK